jgi:hypothetical protein
MKKTSLYLEPELDRRLERAAAEEGITKAEYVRRALRASVAERSRPLIRAIGVGQGPGDVADDVDRHLAETGFGDA